MHQHVCLCGMLCNCMSARVEETTSITEYGRLCSRMCGTICCCMRTSVTATAVLACLRGGFCTCMHACVADIACVAEDVTAGNCVQARVADYATTCVRVCAEDNAVPVLPIMALQACLLGGCNLRSPMGNHIHACMTVSADVCSTMCDYMACRHACVADHAYVCMLVC